MRACSRASKKATGKTIRKAKYDMLTVYSCITNAHDLRLVGLAAVICALASFTSFTLLHHVRKSTGRMRSLWPIFYSSSLGG